ncbi:unnamed protein product [Calicophoron daubneyi]|uniref:Uncharacterized protein n=1 Tax=Calicophoron daubneyi TaxID=300641 RepID=A0AAV2T4D9_CALDB
MFGYFALSFFYFQASCLVDTHCHLCDEAFDKDVDEVIERAMANGVKGAIVVTEDRSEFEKVIELKRRYPDWINVALGVHPVQQRTSDGNQPRCVTLEDMDGVPEIIRKYANDIVTLGEIGLDFQPCICTESDSHDLQRAVFATQIRLAQELNIPVNVHSRSASKPAIELLKKEGATRVQMHAFDGRPSQAMVGVAAGFYFSIPPCVLRSEQKQNLVKAVPLTHLLLETDSPVLGASREIRNEPMEVVKVCEYIASAKGVDVATVRQITAENARKLYPNLCAS